LRTPQAVSDRRFGERLAVTTVAVVFGHHFLGLRRGGHRVQLVDGDRCRESRPRYAARSSRYRAPAPHGDEVPTAVRVRVTDPRPGCSCLRASRRTRRAGHLTVRCDPAPAPSPAVADVGVVIVRAVRREARSVRPPFLSSSMCQRSEHRPLLAPYPSGQVHYQM
jgi:hypothetical protein